MNLNVLEKRQKEVIEKLKTADWLSEFYLAGGTGLALQIGHRLSEDFDFFTEKDFDADLLTYSVQKDFGFEKISEDKNTLIGVIDNVRISFLGFKYKIISQFEKYENIRIAGIKDIACMKLSAVTQRSTKKDFIDIYYLLKRFKLKDLFGFYNEKFGTNGYETILRKSLVYFSDADEDPMPRVLEKLEWSDVKKEIEEVVFKSSDEVTK